MKDHAILSLGAAGDELKDIRRQREIVFHMQREGASALLLSAGGNDLFDNGQIANPIEDPMVGDTAHDLVGARFQAFMDKMVEQYLKLFRKVHTALPHALILIHGYGPAFPRNGKWIEKPLRAKGIPKALQHEIIKLMVARFNQTLSRLAARGEFDGKLVHVNVSDIGNKPNQWHDEIHLDGKRYALAADRFRQVLKQRLPTAPAIESGLSAQPDVSLSTADVIAPTVGNIRERLDNPDLGADAQKARLEWLKEDLAKKAVENPSVQVSQDEADNFVFGVRQSLALLGAETDDTPIDPDSILHTEAFVLIDGTRPATYVKDGFIDLTEPRLIESGWAATLREREDTLRNVIASTGRILRGNDRSQSSVFGTAWMISPTRIATAKHVLEAMGMFFDGEWNLSTDFFVDFAVEADGQPDPAKIIKIDHVAWASPDLIAGNVHPSLLDAAVFELAPATGQTLPDPLIMADASHKDAILNDGAFVNVGHPARPNGSWISDGDDGNDNTISRALIEALIGDQFGVKRLSPGRIKFSPGHFSGDAQGHIFTHEATTLGGSSGSPISAMGIDNGAIAGLHFAGEFRTRNFAHWVPAIRNALTQG
jgi:lysophospholipase L1-like esterase